MSGMDFSRFCGPERPCKLKVPNANEPLRHRDPVMLIGMLLLFWKFFKDEDDGISIIISEEIQNSIQGTTARRYCKLCNLK